MKRCPGREYEITAAVNEPKPVKVGDRIPHSQVVAEIANKLIDRPGTLVIWFGETFEDPASIAVLLEGVACGAGSWSVMEVDSFGLAGSEGPPR